LDIKHVTVVGAGTMGNGIAHVCAQFGFEVILNDIKQEFLDRALTTISSNLDRQIKKGVLTEEQKAATLARIRPSLDLRSAVADRRHRDRSGDRKPADQE
jgi:3-hydroxybutyryl-CoA dehydrogenase